MHKTWNKFCFTGGLVETSVTLPGASNIRGYAITPCHGGTTEAEHADTVYGLRFGPWEI